MAERTKGILESRKRVWVADPENGVDIRLINPNPKLAQFLVERGPKMLSDESYEWIVEWVADIGTIVRSRSFMAYGVASLISGTVMRFIPTPLGLR